MCNLKKNVFKNLDFSVTFAWNVIIVWSFYKHPNALYFIKIKKLIKESIVKIKKT